MVIANRMQSHELKEYMRQTSFYFNWPAFKSVYIDECDVRRIRETENEITFEMDFALLPEHPLAKEPEEGDRYSYISGRMTFVDVVERHWREKRMGVFRRKRKPNHGNSVMIFYFGHHPDGYLIYGEFGHLRVDCRTVTVEMDSGDSVVLNA